MLWCHLIAHTNIAADHLLTLIREVAQGAPLHRVWRLGRFPFSITTAYRWFARWLRNQAHLRAHLSRTHPPPQGVGSTASQRTLIHLTSAYPNEPCWVTAFQHQNQQNFLL